MHEIPESMTQVAALVEAAKRNGTDADPDTIIRLGLQNWIQELLDEGFEGGYLTAHLTEHGLHITDPVGATAYQDTTTIAAALVTDFQADAHRTLMAVQTQIRHLITTHQIKF
ncbi:hypothetical protein [Lacticaseibacillus absianus]|uniref:hypothetical protein n=1 Tax=Lacticaseibacillus absianus TaxID=2729623 RepID=UPI0015C74C14|nr:hypothetical protein [Lacticaseibacillus absianus]